MVPTTDGQEKIQTYTNTAPWPSLRLWWDGDLLSEQINETKFEKWQYATQTTARLLTGYQFGASMGVSNWPAFVGDILGDWREEVVFVNATYDTLLLFTTQTPTTHRIYALAQNPAYRNCLTLKGYNQSHLTDFYLGDRMSTPPRPKIALTGKEPVAGTLGSSSRHPWSVRRIDSRTVEIEPEGTPVQLELFDPSGRIVQRDRILVGSSRISAPSKGAFVLKIEAERASANFKLLGF